MSRVCQVTGKKPMAGNNVSHAKNRTRRRFEPNLHTHRFWVETEKKFVKLRVSAKGMRIIDKKGIESVIKANLNIFQNVNTINACPQNIISENNFVFAELKIIINGDEELKVVDIIEFNKKGKIISIKAFKG